MLCAILLQLIPDRAAGRCELNCELDWKIIWEMGIFGLPLFLGRGQECREVSNELKMSCNNQATLQISALPCVLPFLGPAISF